MVLPLGHTEYRPSQRSAAVDRPQAAPDAVRASGSISKKELRKVTRRVRSGHVGPTSVYYAGVTAPAIAAGMASLVGASLSRAGVSDYWVLMCSSLIAAMAGITWYLIFMRWSYRHDVGREGELQIETQFEADENGVYWTRGDTRTMVLWPGIEQIELAGSFIRVNVRRGEDFFLPKSWFANRKARHEMYEQLEKLREHALSRSAEAA